MPGIRTNHPHHSLPTDDLAVLAQPFYRYLDLHGLSFSPAVICSNNKPLNSKYLAKFLKKNFKPMSIDYPPRNLQRKNLISFENQLFILNFNNKSVFSGLRMSPRPYVQNELTNSCLL